MRNLSSYLNRRKVRTQDERNAWAMRNGIDSYEKLLQFCESNELRCTGTWVFSTPTPKKAERTTVSVPEEKAAEAPAESEPSDNTWHTPAALRPLRKSAPLPKTSKSKKSSSRKTRSRKKPTPAVEDPEE